MTQVIRWPPTSRSRFNPRPSVWNACWAGSHRYRFVSPVL